MNVFHELRTVGFPSILRDNFMVNDQLPCVVLSYYWVSNLIYTHASWRTRGRKGLKDLVLLFQKFKHDIFYPCRSRHRESPEETVNIRGQNSGFVIEYTQTICPLSRLGSKEGDRGELLND